MEGEDVNASPFYKDRAEWSDVKPLYPSKEECGVVRIVASENFTDAFAYLRAVLLRKELSERAFDLTSECIQLNPANYTIWQYRRDLLEHLNKDLDDELKYVGDIIMENPKNYQVCDKRRARCNTAGCSLSKYPWQLHICTGDGQLPKHIFIDFSR